MIKRSYLLFIGPMSIFTFLSCKPRQDADSRVLYVEGLSEEKSEEAAKKFEEPPVDEPQIIEDAVNMMLMSAAKDAQESPGKNIMRFTHAKTIGCVGAKFKVESDIPAAYKVGLFQKNYEYKTWIRFSSFAFQPAPDTTPDNRGMALKILDVPYRKLADYGETSQNVDLVLTNDISFFFRTPIMFKGFLENLASGKKPKDWLDANPSEGEIFKRNVMSGMLGSLLDGTYGSMTPFLIGGNNAMKIVAEPQKKFNMPRGTTPDFLREKLEKDLKSKKEFAFDIFIIPFEHRSVTPIEDPGVDWTTKRIKVAELTIPKQDPNIVQERMAFCEQLQYSPWRTLPEHRPLGGINRLRRAAYTKLSSFRHAKVPYTEPTAGEFPSM